jgi:hypothetical protein
VYLREVATVEAAGRTKHSLGYSLWYDRTATKLDYSRERTLSEVGKPGSTSVDLGKWVDTVYGTSQE